MSNKQVKQKIYGLLLTLGIAASPQIANAAENPAPSSDNGNEPKTENVMNNVNSAIKIYENVSEIRSKEDFLENIRNFAAGGERAHYNPSGNFVVSQTYHINDDVAFNIATSKNKDAYVAAVEEVKQLLQSCGYKGKMPENLKDLSELKRSENLGLTGRKAVVNAAKIKHAMQVSGLEEACDIFQAVARENTRNTSIQIIKHELEHAKSDAVKKKSETLNYLCSPQDYMLLCIADEMNSYIKGDRAADIKHGADIQQVMQDFMKERSSIYLEHYAHGILDDSFWYGTTHDRMVAQQLNIKYENGIVDSRPVSMDWDAESFYVDVPTEHRSYGVSKMVDEANGVYIWSDREAKDGETHIAVSDKGKKCETNILYNLKTNKPVLDKDGHKIYAKHKYNDFVGQHEIVTFGKVASIEGTFDKISNAHFETLAKEILGEEIGSQAVKIIQSLKSSSEYRLLKAASKSIEIDDILSAKAEPISQERSVVLQGYRISATEVSTEGYKDISNQFYNNGDTGNTLVLSSNDIYQSYKDSKLQENKGR